MPLTKTDIANAALGRVGQMPITDFLEDSPTAERVREIYPQTLRKVAGDHVWNCLKKRTSLPRLATAPPFGYRFAYQLPSDFIRIFSINDECVAYQMDGVRGGIEYDIEDWKILTNAEQANIVYIAEKHDASVYDSDFEDALTIRLAANLAVPLRGDTGMAQEYERLYNNVVLPAARTEDANANNRRRFSQAFQSRGNRSRGFSTGG